MALEINPKRLMSRIETMASFNATPGEGVTRFSYSAQDIKAREYLAGLFREAGLEAVTDGVGNIRARLAGASEDAPSVMSGSHIDSVLHGGMYDGIVGTLGALEAIQSIAESGERHRHPLEVIVFAEEEGSNFGSTLAGSKALVGAYSPSDLKKLKNPDGVSMYDMAKAAGYNPDEMPSRRLRPEKIKAMVELHIEQSVVLEARGVPVGIVEGIAGIKGLLIRLTGVANHAGATPMNLRQDPMAATAQIISLVRTLAEGSGSGSAVATVGRISCSPNVPNIIPGKVTFSIDIRDVRQSGIDGVLDGLAAVAPAIAASFGVTLEIIPVSESAPVILDPGLTTLIENCAKARGADYIRMNSGAVHDSCMIAPLLPAGMIFVPSRGGRSHVPEEHTSPDEIAGGAALLADVLLELAR
jgi:allantoate deiminase